MPNQPVDDKEASIAQLLFPLRSSKQQPTAEEIDAFIAAEPRRGLVATALKGPWLTNDQFVNSFVIKNPETVLRLIQLAAKSLYSQGGREGHYIGNGDSVLEAIGGSSLYVAVLVGKKVMDATDSRDAFKALAHALQGSCGRDIFNAEIFTRGKGSHDLIDALENTGNLVLPWAAYQQESKRYEVARRPFKSFDDSMALQRTIDVTVSTLTEDQKEQLLQRAGVPGSISTRLSKSSASADYPGEPLLVEYVDAEGNPKGAICGSKDLEGLVGSGWMAPFGSFTDWKKWTPGEKVKATITFTGTTILNQSDQALKLVDGDGVPVDVEPDKDIWVDQKCGLSLPAPQALITAARPVVAERSDIARMFDALDPR